MKEKKQDPLTDHHIMPRSRGGTRGRKDENIKRVPSSYHEAYHKLFYNMTPREIMVYLEKMWFTNCEFIAPQRWK